MPVQVISLLFNTLARTIFLQPIVIQRKNAISVVKRRQLIQGQHENVSAISALGGRAIATGQALGDCCRIRAHQGLVSLVAAYIGEKDREYADSLR